MHPYADNPIKDDNQRDAGSYMTELERLLHVCEPGNKASAAQLLETYASMEHELIECSCLFYAGKGSFRVASDDNRESGLQWVLSSEALHLPTSVIGTYGMQSRRGRAAPGAKLEDVREPTAVGGSNRRRIAAIAPRRRANSFTANLQYEAGVWSEDDENQASVVARRASTPMEFSLSNS